jgi:hypothetical protein
MTLAVSGLSAALYQDEPEEYVVTAALGSNRDICFASKNGTDASVEIIVSGNNTPLTIADSGTKITINSATGAGGAATSTAAQIVAAFNLDAEAAALFTARLPPSQTGAGVTGAMAEVHAADGVAFTTITLTDSGDGLTFQAAVASRYWDPAKNLDIFVNAGEVTTGFTVNYLRGSVTFDTTKSGSTITATGTKRSILAMRRVLLVYDGKLNIDGKEIDTSNLDDSGWGSAVMGSKSWELQAGAYYYDGNLPIDQIGNNLITKFYSIYASNKSFTGWGAIMNHKDLVASASDAQKQDITIKGSGEIYPE